MIKKLSYIKSIRSFIDFQSNIEFKKKNIIYAPNGTGKTNLSRLLKILKDSESINQLKSQEASSTEYPEFSIACSQEVINHTNYQTKKEPLSKLLVFNSDYIDETIKSEDFSTQDVSGKIEIPVGKESNEIETIEKEITSKTEIRKKEYEFLREKFESFNSAKEKIKDINKEDRSVWATFKFDKLVSTDFVISPQEELDSFADCEENLKKLKMIDENSQLTNLNPKKIDSESINFQDLVNELKDPKQFEFADTKTQQILGQITKEWLETKDIKKGVVVSRKAHMCLLCQRDLDKSVNQLFDNYELYFKNAESKFKDKLTTIKSQIKKRLEEIAKINNNHESNVNSNCSILKIEKSWKTIDNAALSKQLNDLVSCIDDKIATINVDVLSSYSDISVTTISREFKELNNALLNNGELIDEINKKLKDSGKRKTELRIEVGKKWLRQFYVQEKSKVESIESLNYNLTKLYQELSKEKEKLPASDVLSNLIKVANLFLHKYLCLTKYSFDESSDKIVVKLNDKNISSETKQKISEGEKTMLSLCYFMGSSIREYKRLEDFLECIFVIDDPVNSTSYNYLFGIGYLLKVFDEEIAKEIWQENNYLNKSKVQKIILTHNSPLFNVLKTQVFKQAYNSDKSPKIGYFLLNNNGLEVINSSQLKTEFESSLLSIKKAFKDQSNGYLSGNDIRKVLETIKHFCGWEGDFNAENLKTIFRNFNEVNHGVFFLVINYYSHGSIESHNDPLHPDPKPFLDQFNELMEQSIFKDLWEKLER